jgi:hypothetical protein
MDSVLNYPMYDALVQAFSIPGPANVTAIAAVMNQSSMYHVRRRLDRSAVVLIICAR